MAIMTRDRIYGWNVKLAGLPHVWFGERAGAVRFLGSVDAERYICDVRPLTAGLDLDRVALTEHAAPRASPGA